MTASSVAKRGIRNPATGFRFGARVPGRRLSFAKSEIGRKVEPGAVPRVPDSGQTPIVGKPVAQPFFGRITSAEPTVATFSFWLVPVRSRMTDPVASFFSVTAAR